MPIVLLPNERVPVQLSLEVLLRALSSNRRFCLCASLPDVTGPVLPFAIGSLSVSSRPISPTAVLGCLFRMPSFV
jgi:hypothetical protein